MKQIKCECPEEASYNPIASMIGYLPEEEAGKVHKPNKCKGTYELRQYKREDKILRLCSCCCMGGDKELPTNQNGIYEAKKERYKSKL